MSFAHGITEAVIYRNVRRGCVSICRMKIYCLLMVSLMISHNAAALGPHEILLLVNGNSEESMEIASRFAELRRVPENNIVRLELPADAGYAFSMSHLDYTRLIWSPAVTAVNERGLAEQVHAWVFSTGFPVMIQGEPELSIQGITFLRNKWPEDPMQAKDGRYVSPIFAGRTDLDGSAHYPQSFDLYHQWLMGDMPLPSMMLGYTGPNGNTKEEILACMSRGALSDRTRPEGEIYFIDTDDIRSKCREWQFPMVQNELENMGVRCIITNELPVNQKSVMGIMMGAPGVDFSGGNEYRPGAMAEHLTSFAAVFKSKSQTKLTEWIRAGVTASAGTVTEPHDIWTKFPDARFFVYYASGCSMIESFYQAIRCPLQILLVGDPLSEPWAPNGTEFRDPDISENDSGAAASIKFSIKSDGLEYLGKMLCLVDGRIMKSGGEITIRAKDYADGREHTVTAVAFRTGLVKNQVFKTLRFRIEGGKVLFPGTAAQGAGSR